MCGCCAARFTQRDSSFVTGFGKGDRVVLCGTGWKTHPDLTPKSC